MPTRRCPVDRTIPRRLARASPTTRAVELYQRMIAALDRITSLIMAEHPLPSALQAVVRTISSAADMPIVLIEFYEPSLQRMECVAATGLAPSDNPVGRQLAVEQSLSGRVARSGQVVIATQAKNLSAESAEALRRLGAQTLACMPLVISERVIGSLTLAHPDVVVIGADLIHVARHLASLIATLIARRQAETSARLDEQRLRKILDNLASGVLLLDSNGSYLYANARAVAGLRIATSDMVGKSYLEILPPELAYAEEAWYGRSSATQAPSEYEISFDTPTGSQTLFMTHQLLSGSQGSDPTLLISGVDITDRKRAEELVAAQRDLARLIATLTTPEVAWPRCLDLAMRVTGMDCGGIYLYDADDQVLRLVYHRGLSERFVRAAASYPLNTTNTHLVLTGESLYLSAADLRQVERFEHESISCIAVMPILHQGQVLGSVNLGSHSLPEVPAFARHAIETISTEIGNVLVALRTAAALRELNQTLEARVAQRTAEVQDLYDHAPVGYYSLDADGRLVRINQTALDWLGYTHAELLGRPLSDIMPPSDQALNHEHFAQLKAQASICDVELELIRKDGSTFPALINSTAIYDERGTFVMSRSTLTDLTLRKQTDAALQTSEEQYRILVENMTQGVIVAQDGRVAFCNEAAVSIIGYTADELLGASVEDLAKVIRADGMTGLGIWLETQLSGVSVFYTPFCFVRPGDGELRWVISDATMTTYHGRPAMLVMLSDVTALKLAEEQLRLSEARLHLLLAKTPAVIFSALADKNFQITFISDSIQNVLGYAPAQFLRNPRFWATCIHPEDQAQIFGDVALLRQQGWCQYEYRCRHADDSYRWIESGVSLVQTIASHPAEVIGYMLDITERKQAEEILRQANRDMAHAAHMKDEFLANMSHELRSPLNAILGFSESLLEGIYEPLSTSQQGAIRHIESSGQHLLDLITDILDVSKVEAGKMTLDMELIRVDEVCQASLLFVRELAIKKSIQLSFRPSDALALMEADPRRLKQILVNLLSNAVKFTPPGGQVSLEVAPDPSAGAVRFAVRDTGIGISSADLAQLFQPFVQLDSRLSRQHAGTGLGLALVRRLAALHNGEVTVESELGVGSCFTLILPYHPPEQRRIAAL